MYQSGSQDISKNVTDTDVSECTQHVRQHHATYASRNQRFPLSPLAGPLLEPSVEIEESCDTLDRLVPRDPEWCSCQDLAGK
jgi:hypothetical protein